MVNSQSFLSGVKILYFAIAGPGFENRSDQQNKALSSEADCGDEPVHPPYVQI